MGKSIRYIEYNGQPVVSARDLYAFITNGEGLDVTAWVEYCSKHKMVEENTDFFKIRTEKGLPDVLMIATYAALTCSSFNDDRAKSAYAYIRSLLNANDAPDENEIRDTDASSISISEAAKIVNLQAGPTGLFKILKEAMILMKSGIPYQNYVSGGLFKVVHSEYNRPDGSAHHFAKTFVTPTGLEFIKKILLKNKHLAIA